MALKKIDNSMASDYKLPPRQFQILVELFLLE